MCAETNVGPSEWEFMETLPTLYCYFNASNLINIEEGQIDVNKSNEHFATNYPVNTMDLFACASTSKYVPVSERDANFLTNPLY